MCQCIHLLGGMITGGSGVMVTDGVTDGVTDVVTDGVTDVGEGERGSNFMKKCNFSIKNNMYIPRFFCFYAIHTSPPPLCATKPMQAMLSAPFSPR